MARVITKFSTLAGTLAGLGALLSAPALAQSTGFGAPAVDPDRYAGPNGYGRDKDGDGNPATDALGYYRVSPIGEAELDPPFRLVTFEPPPMKHGESITTQYKKSHGVDFSEGLFLQVCDGQRYFKYDTSCTYEAPPSGKFAAVYHHDYRDPLQVKFDQPVCAASLAITPTGGREGERFIIAVEFFNTVDGEEKRVGRARTQIKWTQNTFRFKSMVEAFFLNRSADRMDITIRSRSRRSENFDFLIDDLAYIEDGGLNPGDACRATLDEVLSEGELGKELTPAERAALIKKMEEDRKRDEELQALLESREDLQQLDLSVEELRAILDGREEWQELER